MKNHSSVHLLQKTLQDFLGNNVHQAGSRVDENSFRFDFTYHGRLNDNLIAEIESSVNNRVNSGFETKIEYLSLEEAKKRGAMALFDDKYGDVVRMVTIGDSIELCAGTHVKNTKDIGKIAIISIENKGADTFRIEGATKNNINKMLHIAAEPYQKEILKLLTKAKKLLSSSKEEGITLEFKYDFEDKELTSYKDIIDYKEKQKELKEEIKELEKKYKQEKNKKTTSNLTAFTTNIEIINGIKVNMSILEDYDNDTLKSLADAICNKYEDCLVVLANVKNKAVNIIAKSNTDKVNCGKIVKELSIKCKGNGGGSTNFATGGGKDAESLATFLEEIKKDL